MRIGKLNERIGELSLQEPKQAWGQFRRTYLTTYLTDHAPDGQDTRLTPMPGGNPLKNQHKMACKRTGIDDFTIYDWLHHWASHCVMTGIDLITIMHMGGWKSLRMAQRYAKRELRSHARVD
ncbi:tyrosine-type recombinase/integrase [Sphingobium sp. Cam5-1]|uniref:tyrosine-type recombinase/integrase n=1 Tax=Sphingobium sp. Cam5-1 TaxID=2789327 RepID=UPI001E3F2D23|nr:tyrosine-type recombinase/integrase [Sphingobium sp. Cam5-1]